MNFAYILVSKSEKRDKREPPPRKQVGVAFCLNIQLLCHRLSGKTILVLKIKKLGRPSGSLEEEKDVAVGRSQTQSDRDLQQRMNCSRPANSQKPIRETRRDHRTRYY